VCPLHAVILAFHFGGTVLLFVGHSFDDLEPVAISDVPAIVRAKDDTNVTVWAPAYKKLELRTLPPEHSPSSGSREIDETYVRPAWGMFVVTVAIWLHLLLNTERGDVAYHILPSLF
jgi:hypothetical protein